MIGAATMSRGARPRTCCVQTHGLKRPQVPDYLRCSALLLAFFLGDRRHERMNIQISS